MAKNGIRTSRRVAHTASKVLSNPHSSRSANGLLAVRLATVENNPNKKPVVRPVFCFIEYLTIFVFRYLGIFLILYYHEYEIENL